MPPGSPMPNDAKAPKGMPQGGEQFGPPGMPGPGAQDSDSVYVESVNFEPGGSVRSIDLIRLDTKTGRTTSVRRPGPGANPNAFSLFHYVDGHLVCVESVNAPVDHMMSRKLLEAGRSPDPAVIADASIPLKNHLS